MNDRARLEKWVVETWPLFDAEGNPLLNDDGTPQEQTAVGWKILTPYLDPSALTALLAAQPIGKYRLVGEQLIYGMPVTQEMYLDGQGTALIVNQPPAPTVAQLQADIDRLLRGPT